MARNAAKEEMRTAPAPGTFLMATSGAATGHGPQEVGAHGESRRAGRDGVTGSHVSRALHEAVKLRDEGLAGISFGGGGGGGHFSVLGD